MSNEGIDANGYMKHHPVKKGEGLGVGVVGGRGELFEHATVGTLPLACGIDPAF